MRKRLLITLLYICSLPILLSAQSSTIKILAVNDMHSAVKNFPKLAYVVDSIRQQFPDLLLISAGDNRTGDPINDIYPEPNWPMTYMMNELGFNVSCLGNHEWDGGQKSLSSIMKKSRFQYICANAFAADSLNMNFKPFTNIQIGKIRIGLLGLLNIKESGLPACMPDNTKGFRFIEPMGAADKYRFLKDVCNVFIVVSHMGYTNDEAFAKIFPEADLIIGGHSHDSIPGDIVNGVLITQAKNNLNFVSEITLEIREGKVVSKQSKLISLKDKKDDPLYRELVNQFANNPILNSVIAQSRSDFNNVQELGCLMADAVANACGADIALINRGSVRYKTKAKGNITIGDVLRLDPFGNTIITLNVKGSDIPSIIEACAKGDPSYGPPFVAGLQYNADLGKTPTDIKRLDIKLANGKKINNKKTYKICMSSYLAQVSCFKKKYELNDTYIVTSDAIIEFLKENSIVDYQGVKRLSYTADFEIKE